MGSMCKTFCRALLADVMKDVKEKVSKEDIKKAWTWKDRYLAEFHGPDEFYYPAKTCCLWNTRAEGWMRYLDWLEIKNRKEAKAHEKTNQKTL